jgi:glycosyltransferase involved in cell wall biosynthesis
MLNFLRWLKANDDLEFDVKLLQGGPLVAEFEKLAPTEVIASSATLPRRVLRRVVAGPMAKFEAKELVRRLSADRYALAYVNTVVPKREMMALAEAGLPVICHVHEMDFSIRYWLGPEGLTSLVDPVSRFIAVSRAVRDELVCRWHAPESKVSVVHAFTPSTTQSAKASDRAGIRTSLGLTDDDVLVGGCGTLDWRKGADLFLQVARATEAEAQSRRKTHFVWLGADRASSDYYKFMHDLEQCGLQDRVTVLESTPHPGAVFAAMDVFALTSREDPFPLVMLEAAALKVPMICFANSGGGPEFAADGAGVVAPYLDVSAFASEISRLANDPNRRRQIGEIASSRVAERFTIERQAPKLRDIIRATLR